MSFRITIAAFIVACTTFLGSCVKDDYYNTNPSTPVGYQYTFDDNFNYDAHNWSFSDQQNDAYVNVSDGMLNYFYNPVNDGSNTVAIQTGGNFNRDFLIQTRLRSDYIMGVCFGVSDYDYGYSFMIDESGYFAVFKEGDANTAVRTLIDWQYNAAIQRGWNDIDFEQTGNYWTGYVNGTKVFDLPAEYLRGSKIGYIVLAGTNGNADYLSVQW